MSQQSTPPDDLPEPDVLPRRPSESPYAVPLGTLVGSAYVSAPEHVILQPDLDGPGPGDAGGGADGGD